MAARFTTKNSKGGRLLISSLFILAFALGQNAVSESFTEADAELNGVYKQALLSLPIGSQEPLRRAERAWIDFSNRNVAVLHALRRSDLISEEAIDTAI